ncbi:MAG: hypothetical protein WC564_00805 [Patescibacteria group bacterium]|jgi:hypothetical protein
MKKKVIVKGLRPTKQKDEPESILVLSYNGEVWQLNDQKVTEKNFRKVREKSPEQMVSIRRYLTVKEVPIREVKVKEMR